jgi:hypothetical protein
VFVGKLTPPRHRTPHLWYIQKFVIYYSRIRNLYPISVIRLINDCKSLLTCAETNYSIIFVSFSIPHYSNSNIYFLATWGSTYFYLYRSHTVLIVTPLS